MTTSLVDICDGFIGDDDSALRAVFDAAMKQRIESEEGYSVADSLYELYRTQAHLQTLRSDVDALQDAVSELKKCCGVRCKKAKDQGGA